MFSLIVNYYVRDALGRRAVGGLCIFELVPIAKLGVQAWDRYAGINNNPITYTDPSVNSPNCITTQKSIYSSRERGGTQP
jgi:hypothetical protein